MRKLTLPLMLLAALSMSVVYAGAAAASDLGDRDIPNLDGSPGSSDDWGGHAESHCNNLGSVDYYNVPIPMVQPGSDHNIAQTQTKDGTSFYHVDPDTNLNGTGGGSCGGPTVLIATGYYDGTQTGNNDLPSCANPTRNPCNDTSAFYVGVPVTPTGEDPVTADGRVDAGQKGVVP